MGGVLKLGVVGKLCEVRRLGGVRKLGVVGTLGEVGR